ncbi:hypothetical protein GGX14DRAFT_546769 [Mycena pura]|uniref:Uncharacterized protein n=1 Tax=Mycena pura TaxID=153505 RepID=A0AAD6XX11_9AGAR|nr:hypothetical protein GGX14DRAFT_546769 [Mycena pura]
MGGFWSCCKRQKSPESAPLLGAPASVEDPPYSIFEKLGDCIGAFNSGKLPSQDQISALLQHVLRSEFLCDSTNAISQHGGTLSRQGATVVFAIRELVDALLRIGLEKNYDDKLQDFLFITSQESDLKIRPEIVIDGSPLQIGASSAKEFSDDAENFLQSLKALSKLALTSSIFRMFLSDILTTTREILAEGASEIGEIAAQVQLTAVNIAQTAELDNLTVEAAKEKAADSYSGLRESVTHANENLGTLGEDSAHRVRNLVVGRVQELVTLANRNPEHQTAIHTILMLLRKYSEKLTAIADSADQSVTIDTEVDKSATLHVAMVDFKVLLERFASGHSLDPLVRAFKAATTDILDVQNESRTELNRYFTDLDHWVTRALAEPQFAASRLGTRTAEELFNAGRLLLLSEANAQWAQDVRLLVAEAETFVHALDSDTATQRLIKSFNGVSSAVRGLMQDTVLPGAHAWRGELVKDALAWLIPRAFKSIRALPMPRVEFKNSTFEVAVDALLLTGASSSASLVPDHISVQNWNEVRVDMAAGTPAETSSRTRVHIDGMRCAMHRLGYYVKYNGIIQYSDEGVLDVDFGRRDAVGEGLAVDIELETKQHERDTPGEPLFRLVNNTVAVPGLSFAIKHSKHWILNMALIEPLAAPTVRLFLKNLLEREISKRVEWADRVLSAVFEEADRIIARRPDYDERHTLEVYWAAILKIVPTFFEKRDSGSIVKTHTEPTFKGIIHTTTTAPDDRSSSSSPEETVVAVGAGAQLFPNKGGAYGVEEATTSEVAQEAVGEIRQAIERGAGKTRESLEYVGVQNVGMIKDFHGLSGSLRERLPQILYRISLAGESVGSRPVCPALFHNKRYNSDVAVSERAFARSGDPQHGAAVRVGTCHVGVSGHPVLWMCIPLFRSQQRKDRGCHVFSDTVTQEFKRGETRTKRRKIVSGFGTTKNALALRTNSLDPQVIQLKGVIY